MDLYKRYSEAALDVHSQLGKEMRDLARLKCGNNEEKIVAFLMGFLEATKIIEDAYRETRPLIPRFL